MPGNVTLFKERFMMRIGVVLLCMHINSTYLLRINPVLLCVCTSFTLCIKTPILPFLAYHEYNSQKYKSARKIAYKGASLLAIYKAHLVRVRTRQIITMTDLMLMTRVWRFKATTVTRDFSKCRTTVDSRQSMSISWNSISIELAVFKAITVTKEFSKQLQLCPLPRIVSYWLLRSQDSHQDISHRL